jgi:predicted SAM-dependent methyltransferase
MSKKKCFICGSDMSNFLIGEDFALGTSEKQYTIIKCSNCWLEEIYPMPNHKEQATFYPKNYYSYENKKQAKKEQVNLIDMGMEILDFLFHLFEPKGYYIRDYKNSNWKKFIDIWCGEGINLDAMTKKWWEAFWFEIGKQERKGNIFYGGNIKDVNRGTKFDLIYMSHVFEHIDTPEETLETLKTLLNDNGKIVILLPSSNSLSSLLLGKYAPERDIPRHLFTYNKKNLSLLFKNKWFIIKSSNSLRQYGLLVWFARYLKDKFKFNLKNSKLKYIFFFVFFIELLLTIIRYTNHRWFVLEIKK